jgi:hypothetical protein
VSLKAHQLLLLFLLPSMPRSYKLSFPFRLSNQNSEWISFHQHIYYMHHPLHWLILHHINNIGEEFNLWCSCHFTSLRSKNSLQHPVLETFNLSSFFYVRQQVSYPYKTTCRITILSNLFFMFLDSRQEDKRFWTGWKQALHTIIQYKMYDTSLNFNLFFVYQIMGNFIALKWIPLLEKGEKFKF